MFLKSGSFSKAIKLSEEKKKKKLNIYNNLLNFINTGQR
jgi:hypothetical protein